MTKEEYMINLENLIGLIDSDDRVLHPEFEQYYIYNLLNNHLDNLDEAKQLLLNQSKKKYNDRMKKTQSIDEEKFAALMYKRSLALIEEAYSRFIMWNKEKNNPNVQDAEYATVKLSNAQNDLLFATTQYNLLKLFCSENVQVFNLTIDINEYSRELQVFEMKKEDAKNFVATCKDNYDLVIRSSSNVNTRQ